MPRTMKNLCVYASSSQAVDAAYFEAARDFGAHLAARGHTLVFGAGCVGLMGEVARAVHAADGHVVGVIPKKLVHKEIAYEAADEFIVTDTMRERKAIMESRADAFIALPGGIGTLEEVLEVLVLKQLRFHEKPIVFLNTHGFYHGLMELLERQISERFAKPVMRALYHAAATPAGVFNFLDAYTPPNTDDKWF